MQAGWRGVSHVTPYQKLLFICTSTRTRRENPFLQISRKSPNKSIMFPFYFRFHFGAMTENNTYIHTWIPCVCLLLAPSRSYCSSCSFCSYVQVRVAARRALEAVGAVVDVVTLVLLHAVCCCCVLFLSCACSSSSSSYVVSLSSCCPTTINTINRASS